MERSRMLIAVILSTVAVIVVFSIQNCLDQRQQENNPTIGETSAERDALRNDPAIGGVPNVAVLPYGEDPRQTAERTYANNTIRVLFSAQGGSIVSFQLLKHLNGDVPVDMIFRGDTQERAFDLRFGGPDTAPISVPFYFVPNDDPNTVEFQRQFYVPGRENEPFTVRKRYRFYPDEYLFELEIALENSVNEYIPLDLDGTAYTLTIGPQIGPRFKMLDNRNEYRRYYSYNAGKRRPRSTINMNRANVRTLDSDVDWAAIVGKYFTAIAAPGAGEHIFTISDTAIEGIPATSRMFISRPAIRSSINSDTYRFYLGPKIRNVLTRYNDPDDNAFGISGLNFDATLDRRVLLGWLENVLKWFLRIFYRIIPNYGVAIILLTVLVKALLWPLTHKSYESTTKMQSLSPKIQELKSRLGSDPPRMNREMAALYKKEGVNPAGGCLPLLLQFPFFIAMFGLFNNHFDLRGAVFIRGWIDDLSAPESIWNFGNFTLPLLNWNDLRLLPILFVLTQLITSMLTQTPSTNSGQAKMMAYMLPIVFFFILYNMPSGLLVYWIITNVLTAAQQYYNSHIKKRKGA